MARTISQIYDALVDEKETLTELSTLQPVVDDAQTFLQDLTSTSKVAIWRLFLWVVAVGTWTLETLFDRHVAEIKALKYTLFVSTPVWWRERALEFQFGDVLTWNGAQFVYPAIDELAKIVKRAAVVNSPGLVRIKVAKLDVGGLPVPLSGPEVIAFTAYAQMIAPAGISLLVISADADLLKVYYTVYYNPLVLSSSGELLSTPGVFPARDAINNYIQDLPFNGVLNLTALTDALQGAEGIVDPVISSASAKYAGTSYVLIDDNYTSFAGHFTIDPLFPLSSTITYLPAP